MEDINSPDLRGEQSGRDGKTAAQEHASMPGTIYASSNDAVKALRDDFHYWTGKLTDTSLTLSIAIIAANWAVFGSVNAIRRNALSEISLALVLIGLGLGVGSAKWLSELTKQRIDYAESNSQRWKDEFNHNAGKRTAWPFTKGIECLGRATREAKTWLPIAAGILFIVALFIQP